MLDIWVQDPFQDPLAGFMWC
ncbi:hypothetical protein E2C01_076992 [Portunus trituberculatus]|uniref:Uncharacterized protein n=1 Tax=Portunus trituberculatus TaxID=210409 RepID=A0A5B7IJ81_PORTR|nr:hypothetical protein [Portunus trituberculatus]